jgi:hypothetical protein
MALDAAQFARPQRYLVPAKFTVVKAGDFAGRVEAAAPAANKGVSRLRAIIRLPVMTRACPNSFDMKTGESVTSRVRRRNIVSRRAAAKLPFDRGLTWHFYLRGVLVPAALPSCGGGGGGAAAV